MTRINKSIKPEHIGDYNNFIINRYVCDIMDISSNNALNYKTFKINNNNDDSPNILNELLSLGYNILLNYPSETHLIHNTNKSYININTNIAHYYCNKFRYSKSINNLLENFEKRLKINDNVYFLITNNHSMEKIPLTLPKFEVHENNYNINFTIDELIKKLLDNNSGLITFLGDPGTGKSYLIKHLIKNVKKEFIYITQDMVQFLFEPKNIGFVLKNLKDCILIIEDSENLFIDRKKQTNTIISTILNLCDGIMGDLFRIKIIATINIKENIDSAFFRKGRLLAEVNFQKLSIDASNNILQRLGSTVRVNNECTLSELYNYSYYNGHEENNIKIGF